MEKKCIKCQEVKHIDEYYLHLLNVDNHFNTCKECCRKYAKKRHEERKVSKNN